MKKIYLLILLLFTSFDFLSAQCARVDSLNNLLNNLPEGEQRVNTLNILSREFIPEQNNKASFYSKQSFDLAKKIGYKKGQADALILMGDAEYKDDKTKIYEHVVEDYTQALKIYQELSLKSDEATAYEKIGKYYFNVFYADKQNYDKSLENYLNALKIREPLGESRDLALNYDMIGELYMYKGDDKQAVDYFFKAVELRKKIGDNSTNDMRLLAKAERMYYLAKERDRLFLYLLMYGIGSILFFVLLMFVILFRLRNSNRTLEKTNAKVEEKNKELQKQKDLIEEQKETIEIEKKLSDTFSFLPPKLFKEMKERGHVDPKQYENVSILFSDLEDFTNISSGLSTHALIEELNFIFNRFDEIIEKFHLIKIKTLGDSYMCAGGIPDEDPRNPVNIVLAGLEMIRFINQIREEKAAKGMPYFKLRIGINTGYVVAGVVGKKKMAFDLWGNTVNVAKLMESNSVAGKVNVSEFTHTHVKEFFNFEPHVEMKIKHKEYIEEFVVAGIKAEYSVDGNGMDPNQAFKEKIAAMALLVKK